MPSQRRPTRPANRGSSSRSHATTKSINIQITDVAQNDDLPVRQSSHLPTTEVMYADLAAYPFAPPSPITQNPDSFVITEVEIHATTQPNPIPPHLRQLANTIAAPRLTLPEAIARTERGHLYPTGFPVDYDPSRMLPHFAVVEMISLLNESPVPRAEYSLLHMLDRRRVAADVYEEVTRAEAWVDAVEKARARGELAPPLFEEIRFDEVREAKRKPKVQKVKWQSGTNALKPKEEKKKPELEKLTFKKVKVPGRGESGTGLIAQEFDDAFSTIADSESEGESSDDDDKDPAPAKPRSSQDKGKGRAATTTPPHTPSSPVPSTRQPRLHHAARSVLSGATVYSQIACSTPSSLSLYTLSPDFLQRNAAAIPLPPSTASASASASSVYSRQTNGESYPNPPSHYIETAILASPARARLITITRPRDAASPFERSWLATPSPTSARPMPAPIPVSSLAAGIALQNPFSRDDAPRRPQAPAVNVSNNDEYSPPPLTPSPSDATRSPTPSPFNPPRAFPLERTGEDVVSESRDEDEVAGGCCGR